EAIARVADPDSPVGREGDAADVGDREVRLEGLACVAADENAVLRLRRRAGVSRAGDGNDDPVRIGRIDALHVEYAVRAAVNVLRPGRAVVVGDADHVIGFGCTAVGRHDLPLDGGDIETSPAAVRHDVDVREQ